MAKNKKSKAAKQGDGELSKLARSRATQIPRTTKEVMEPVVQPPVIWRQFFLFLGIVFVVAMLTYVPTLWHGLVFNDRVTMSLLQTRNLTDMSGTLWQDALVRPLSEPWTRASFVMDLRNYTDQFGWYHLVNMFLHACATAYLYCLVFRIAWRYMHEKEGAPDAYKLALLTAGIFACHPLATQTVTYISARAALLSTTNVLLALNGFLIGLFATSFAGRFWGYSIAAVGTLMAINAGAFGVTAPLAMLLLLLVLKPIQKSLIDWVSSKPIVSAALVSITIFVPMWTLVGAQQAGAANFLGMPALSTQAYLATQAKALVTYYLRCFFVPLGLSIDPPFATAENFFDPFAIAGSALLLAGVYGIFKFRHAKILASALVLFLCGYLPNFLVIRHDAVTDCAIYLSLTGLSLLAAWLVSKELPATGKNSLAVSAVIITVLAGLSIWRTSDWTSDNKLFQSTLTTNQRSTLAHTLLGGAYLNKNDSAKAHKEIDEALAIDPNLAMAHVYRGTILNKNGEYEKGQDSFKKALQLALAHKLPPPVMASANLGLAESYVHTGKSAEARALVVSALPFVSDQAKAALILTQAAYGRGDYQEAFDFAGRLVQSPARNSTAWLLYAKAAYQLGKYSEADYAARMASLKDPTFEGRLLLGKCELIQGNPGQAAIELERAVKLDSNDAAAMALLSIAYERAGDKALAQSYAKDARKLDPHIFEKQLLPAAPTTKTKEKSR